MNVIVSAEKKKLLAVSALTRPESLSTSYLPGSERDQNFKSSQTPESRQHREAVHNGALIIICYGLLSNILRSLSILS